MKLRVLFEQEESDIARLSPRLSGNIEKAYVDDQEFTGTSDQVEIELDTSTERIVNYLSSNFGVPINVIFFRYFKEGKSEYLSRSWLIDPAEVEAKSEQASKKRSKEPWNGRDYYVSFGEGESHQYVVK